MMILDGSDSFFPSSLQCSGVMDVDRPLVQQQHKADLVGFAAQVVAWWSMTG